MDNFGNDRQDVHKNLFTARMVDFLSFFRRPLIFFVVVLVVVVVVVLLVVVVVVIVVVGVVVIIVVIVVVVVAAEGVFEIRNLSAKIDHSCGIQVFVREFCVFC